MENRSLPLAINLSVETKNGKRLKRDLLDEF